MKDKHPQSDNTATYFRGLIRIIFIAISTQVILSCFPAITSRVDPVPFQPSQLEFIEHGKTKRTDVLAVLGEPTIVRRSGRLLVYAAAANTRRLVIATLGDDSLLDHYFLFIDLTGDGTVIGHEVVSSRWNQATGTRENEPCRGSGICVISDPWIETPRPPWRTVGEVTLPQNADIAVLTDTFEADAAAKTSVPGEDECLLYIWGISGGYTEVIGISVNNAPWRALEYISTFPQSYSVRTFIWRRLEPGVHAIRAGLFSDGRLRQIEEIEIECAARSAQFYQFSMAGGFLHAPAVKFESLTPQKGRLELNRSRAILE